MTNGPGKRDLYRADYTSIAEWNANYKADVAEEIAVNSLRQGLQEDPAKWSGTGYNFKKARGSQIHIYDPYYNRMKNDDEKMWRPDGLFYSDEWDSDADASEHIVLQEVKTGTTVPDLRESQYERMKKYAKLSKATVYYSFVEFAKDGFNLSMIQLRSRPDGIEWWWERPPGTKERLPAPHEEVHQ